MDSRTHLIIVSLRIGAVLLMIATVYLLNRLMLWLPWQADCVVATVAALLFAYRFERS